MTFSYHLNTVTEADSAVNWTLRKKCMYSGFFWSVIFRIQTEYREIESISPYSDRMREKTDQKNSEYGHLSRNWTVVKEQWSCNETRTVNLLTFTDEI